MHVFGLWEEAGVPGKNPHKHRGDHEDSTQKSPHQGLKQESSCCVQQSEPPSHHADQSMVMVVNSGRSLLCHDSFTYLSFPVLKFKIKNLKKMEMEICYTFYVDLSQRAHVK